MFNKIFGILFVVISRLSTIIPLIITTKHIKCKNKVSSITVGVLSSLLFPQELQGGQKNKPKTKTKEELYLIHYLKRKLRNLKLNSPVYEVETINVNTLKKRIDNMKLFSDRPFEESYINYSYATSSSSIYHDASHSVLQKNYSESKSLFGKKETLVYLTLFDDFCRQRTSGTQATASVNKCFQVYSNENTIPSNSDFCSSCSTNVPHRDSSRYVADGFRYSEVYFFGRKSTDKKGVGGSASKTRLCKSSQPSGGASKSTDTKNRPRFQATQSQTKRSRGATTSTGTTKSVSIKDDKCEKPCPAMAASKGEMMATVSHIKIGPKETCPVHGKEPCQGPKCIVASTGEVQAPVKVTTVTNARRGVFELVIRRITGAPLAKNELMLEWTPPPSRPPPCSSPCPIPCAFPIACRPSKCKMIVCKPSPCRPKCCKKKPCGQPCISCKKCCKTTCCSKPCPPPRCPTCAPFPPPPCKKPCTPPCCKSPCRSSPCLRPCPIGRRRPRKTKSTPKIKAHKKHISPCSNSDKCCPVVKCRSVPGCCAVPLPCPPRKCCSVSPCKPPKCCKSNCSTCC